MKFFNVFALACLFFFVISCGEDERRPIKASEVNDGDRETVDDADTDSGTSDEDPTDTDNPVADEDLTDTDTPVNDGDTDEPVDDGDADNPVNDNEPQPDGDNQEVSGDAEKCANAGGTWDPSAQNCYRIEKCSKKPVNSEWNGESSYKVYYDINVGEWEPGPVYATQYGDGEPQPCQYVCVEKTVYDNGECKPACSAKFNGTDSAIEIAADTAPNLDSDTWTIEAWFKQADEDLNDKNIPIVRKGADTDSPVYVLTGYKKQNYSWNGNDYTNYSTMGYVSYSYTSSTGGGWNPSGNTQSATINPSANVTYSDDWTHIALVQQKETSGNQWQQQTSYKLLLFLNGEQVASSDYKVNNQNVTPTVNTNDEAFVIGANFNAGYFFKGLMDSIKVSNTAKYTEDFTPGVLSADDDTVAFWDFSGDAKDAKSGQFGVETNIEYSTDCKE